MTPVVVRVERFAALAMPKSTTFVTPSGRTMTFVGLTSRCTMRIGSPSVPVAVCAWARPRAASRTTEAENHSGTASPAFFAPRMICPRCAPAMYSIAM